MEPQSIQSLLANKKVVIVAATGIGIIGIIAVISGILSAPSAEQVQKDKATADQKRQTNSLTPTRYPTPLPTIDHAYQYFVKELATVTPASPSATPKPGKFYTANGKQNDLIVKVIRKNYWDILDEVMIINTKTTERRIIGKAFEASPGDSFFFSKDFSKVTFIGGAPRDEDYEKISVYSLSQEKIIKQISLEDMKDAMPALRITTSGILSQLLPSPDGKRAAFSYGETFNYITIHPATSIILIDLSTYKMKLLPEKGLFKAWKDDTTLEYYQTPTTTQEIKL